MIPKRTDKWKERKRKVATLKRIFWIIIIAHIVGAVIFAYFDKGCNERAEEQTLEAEKTP